MQGNLEQSVSALVDSIMPNPRSVLRRVSLCSPLVGTSNPLRTLPILGSGLTEFYLAPPRDGTRGYPVCTAAQTAESVVILRTGGARPSIAAQRAALASVAPKDTSGADWRADRAAFWSAASAGNSQDKRRKNEGRAHHSSRLPRHAGSGNVKYKL